ncbi:MAG: lipopolysaccharide biosynthesis protein [Burkholderiales bacterium]
MSAGAGAVASTIRGLGQRALSLGAVNAFEYAVQFLLPVVLVRCLEPAAFGEYRLLWLAAGTIMAVAPMAMPGCLYYFLPRSDAATRRLYINQTLLFLAAAGLVAAWAVSLWNPWLPGQLHGLAERGVIVPAFVALWVVASLLDVLPTIEERIAWQAKATVGLTALRAVVLSAAAILTRELGPVLLVLLAFVVLKLATLLAYVARYHGLRGPPLDRRAFAGQVKQAAPFGVANALYGLREQADQWVAAALFAIGQFASFSIAAALGMVVTLFRKSASYAYLPGMSRLQAAGDISAMLEVNSRANIMVAALVFPLLAAGFVFAEEAVTIVFTVAYLDAAPVMRVYAIGLVTVVVELATVMMLLQEGAFVMRVNLAALVLSVPLSWLAASHFGLAGAAAGFVLAMFLDRIATLRRISLRTGVSLRRLQDWGTLGRLLLAAVLAAAIAWDMVGRHFVASGPLLRLGAGSALLAAAYVGLALLFTRGRGWLRPLRNLKHGL